MATFYVGPYVKPGGGLSKQIVVGRVATSSKDVVIKIAKLLSKDGGHPKTVVTGEIPEKNFYVRTQDGRVVKLPRLVRKVVVERRRELRKAAKTSRHAR